MENGRIVTERRRVDVKRIMKSSLEKKNIRIIQVMLQQTKQQQ